MDEQGNTSQATIQTSGKAGALAAAAVIAGGLQTYADPVRFDNVGGQFVWNGQHLDITRPYSQQPNTPGPSTSFQTVRVTVHPYPPPSFLINAFAQGSATLAQYYSYGYYVSAWQAISVSKGATINGDMDFSGSNARYFARWSFFPNVRYFQYWFVPQHSVFYLPVRFMDGVDAHYGWIAGEWRGVEGVQALAWGYETTPNTPIAAGAVPAPGTLAALAFGAAALGRRPNRGNPSRKKLDSGLDKNRAK